MAATPCHISENDLDLGGCDLDDDGFVALDAWNRILVCKSTCKEIISLS
jgi:hypothetical protein